MLLWIRELLKSSLPHSHVALRYGKDTSVMQNLIPSCILHFISWPDIKVNHFSRNMQSILFSHVMRCPVRSYGVIYEKCSQLLNHLCSHGLISSTSRGLHEARFGAWWGNIKIKSGFHGGTSHAELDCRPNLHRSNRRNIMEVICNLCKLCKEKST